jgi:periplasmic divalent cation tolerance protein
MAHHLEGDPPLCEVVITAPDATWLAEFTRQLILDGLGASCHQWEIMTTYGWDGEVRSHTEWRAAIRTRVSCVNAIKARTQRDHPYEVPSVVALPIVQSSEDYARWVATARTPQ